MVKHNRNWNQFNDDVVGEIAKKIKSYDDFIAFRGVCSSWRSAVNAKKDFKFMSTQLPWLLLPRKPCTNNNIYDFFSLSRGMSRQIVLPEVHNKKYLCSKGWLLTTNNGRMSMLHPFTGAHIELPPLNGYMNFPPYELHRKLYANGFITKFVLSSNPSLTSDYVAMVIFGGARKLAYARSGDKTWTIIETWRGMYKDITYYKGMFYAINYKYEIMACDVRDGKYPTVAQVVTRMPPHLRHFGFWTVYILESAGALVVVQKVMRLNCQPPYEFQFRVFKLNLATNTWTEVKHLGNSALFLSQFSSISVETKHTSYCRPNCIYFTGDHAETTIQFFRIKYMAIYDMQSRRTEILNGSSHDVDDGIPLMWVEQSF